MKRYKLIILFALASLSVNADILSDLGINTASLGGSSDLSATIAKYMLTQKKNLDIQKGIIDGRSGVMIPMEVNLHRTAEIQQDFNDYLTAFHGVVLVAAQTYGFYHEIQHMIQNYQTLEATIKSAPTNAFAVALKKDQSRVYGQIFSDASGIVGDITKLCFGKDGKTVTKMSEKDRILLVFGIRPKLKQLNRHLRDLALAIRYTSMADVWRDIRYDAVPVHDKKAIVQGSLERWSASAEGDATNGKKKK